MLTRQVALVSETSSIGLEQMKTVAEALHKQAVRDFGPIWGVDAAALAFATRQDVPLEYWHIIVKDDLDRPEAAGYHEDEMGQPYALVRYSDDWSVTASHEMLEMLADPWGRHMVAAPSPKDPGKRVKFLVEVCDPCSDYFYEIDGIAVADFYTPKFFEAVAIQGASYSFTGSLTAPRQVLEGGYMTWFDPEGSQWWHRGWFDGTAHRDEMVPIPAIVKGNIRAAVDRHFAVVQARAKANAHARQR